MKIFAIILFLTSCAHSPPPKSEDLVSMDTALMQAQASYLKGCVDGMKVLKVPLAFHGCRDKSILHRRELEEIMSQDVQTLIDKGE